MMETISDTYALIARKNISLLSFSKVKYYSFNTACTSITVATGARPQRLPRLLLRSKIRKVFGLDCTGTYFAESTEDWPGA